MVVVLIEHRALLDALNFFFGLVSALLKRSLCVVVVKFLEFRFVFGLELVEEACPLALSHIGNNVAGKVDDLLN